MRVVMEYRFASPTDIDNVLELQKKYHIHTILPEDKPDGFVTTLFTREQLLALIETENGLTVAVDNRRIAAYVMSASWEYWSAWEFFRFMISRLPMLDYAGLRLGTENSYQYGPVCVDKDYRGTGVLQDIFNFSLRAMAGRYPVLVTFINRINPRSLASHTRKLGLEIVSEFELNGNQYLELACLTRREHRISDEFGGCTQ